MTAGTYAVTETTTTGYDAAVSCSNSASGTDSASVALSPGAAVTCTFTNTAQPASLTVEKVVSGTAPADDWQFTGDLGTFTITNTGGSEIFTGLTPGTPYTVTETAKFGYTPAVSCTNRTSGTDSASIIPDPGEDITCTFTNTAQPASFTVIKVVSGTAPADDWQFTGDLGTFTITNTGGSKTFSNLTAGAYAVTETTTTGYDAAVSCSNSASGTDSASVTLSPGAAVTCTFTNTAQPASLTVAKVVSGTIPASNWQFTGDLGTFTITNTGGSKTFSNLTAGTYAVTETTTTGYDAAVSCSNSASGTNSASVTLSPGAAVTCTFTNTAQPASLTIVKVVSGTAPADDWQFTGDLGAFTITNTGGSKTFSNLTAGAYAVAETAKTGYGVAVSCSNSASGTDSASVTLSPGDAVTCTFTNTAQPASLTIVKVLSGAAPTSNWQFTGDLGAFTITNTGGSKLFSNLTAGAYAVAETAKTGYDVAVSCSNGASGTNSASVTLSPGANVICTFTNTAQPASLTIVKVLSGAAPTSNWQFTGDLGAFTITNTGGSKTFSNLTAGAYAVAETAKTGYDVAVSCSNGASGTNSASVTLSPGANVICTFTNTAQPASLTIVKVLSGAAPISNWQFTGDLGAFTITNTGGSKTFSNLTAGAYAVAETAKTGYGVAVSCSNGASGTNSASVTLSPGANVICTFTNTAQPASLTIVKVLSGAAPISNWQFTGDLGAFTITNTGGSKTFSNLTAGAYAVAETAKTGYGVAVSCSNGASGINSASVTLSPGANVICTFTNTAQPASLTIVKVLSGAAPTSNWQFTGDLGTFTITNTGGSKTFSNLIAGAYAVAETAKTGYGVAVSCSNGASGTNSASVTLSPGANVICTFTNTAQPASLTVVKVLSGAAPTSNWQFTGDLGTFTITNTGGSKTFSNLTAGAYAVAETAKTGYGVQSPAPTAQAAPTVLPSPSVPAIMSSAPSLTPANPLWS